MPSSAHPFNLFQALRLRGLALTPVAVRRAGAPSSERCLFFRKRLPTRSRFREEMLSRVVPALATFRVCPIVVRAHMATKLAIAHTTEVMCSTEMQVGTLPRPAPVLFTPHLNPSISVIPHPVITTVVHGVHREISKIRNSKVCLATNCGCGELKEENGHNQSKCWLTEFQCKVSGTAIPQRYNWNAHFQPRGQRNLKLDQVGNAVNQEHKQCKPSVTPNRML